MRPFVFVEPTSLSKVFETLAQHGEKAHLVAGGSDLLSALKDDVVHYAHLVSLAGLDGMRSIAQEDTGLRLGALVTLAQHEYEPR